MRYRLVQEHYATLNEHGEAGEGEQLLQRLAGKTVAA